MFAETPARFPHATLRDHRVDPRPARPLALPVWSGRTLTRDGGGDPAAARADRHQADRGPPRHQAVQAARPELRDRRRDRPPDHRAGRPGARPTSCSRSAPGFGSLTLPLLAAAGRVVAVEVDPALAAELPRTVAERAPGLAGRLRVVTADAARVRDLPGEPPTALVANLPYNVGGPGRAAPAGHGAVAAPRPGHGAGRGGRPDERPAGQPDLRRAVGQAGLVRRGPPGRAGAAERVLAGAEGRLRPGGLHPARAAAGRGPRRGLRGRGRRVRAAPQDAARRAGPVGGLGRARPSRCSGRRGSTRRGAASRWTWPSSRGSPAPRLRLASGPPARDRVRWADRDACDCPGSREGESAALRGAAA